MSLQVLRNGVMLNKGMLGSTTTSTDLFTRDLSRHFRNNRDQEGNEKDGTLWNAFISPGSLVTFALLRSIIY